MADLPHLVIFAGAGFSVLAGLPVMSEFSDRLRASDPRILTEDEQSDFDVIQVECDSIGTAIGGSARNLEQLSSFLSVMALTQPDYQFRGCKIYRSPDEAMKLIRRCMYKLVEPCIRSERVQSYDYFFGLSKFARITFVTTNYDVVIELAARASNKACIPTKSILSAAKVFDRTKGQESSSLFFRQHAVAKFDLFKLHGSVNWFEHDGNLVVADQVSMKDNPRGQSIADQLVEKELLNPDEALLVPPTVLKSQLHPLLREQWIGASKAISTADHLWFVGYSFPETDSFMRYFLSSSLATNARLKQLLVLDPNRSVKPRAEHMLQRPSLKDVFQFCPARWQDINNNLAELLKRNIIGALGGLAQMLPGILRLERAIEGKGDLDD